MIRWVTVIVATLLTLLTLGAWIDSYVTKGSAFGWARVWDLEDVAKRIPSFSVSTGRGTLGLQHYHGHTSTRELPSKDFSFLGLRRSTFLRNLGFINYYVPFWMLFVLFAAYPTVAFIRGLMRRRCLRRGGSCVNCGYDLRGNVSGVCPECGEPVKVGRL